MPPCVSCFGLCVGATLMSRHCPFISSKADGCQAYDITDGVMFRCDGQVETLPEYT